MAVLARRSRGRRRMMADINVVPYIDVMLVLVVILMVSAPFVNPSLVELPTVGRTARAPDQPIEIVVKADGSLLLLDRSPAAKLTAAMELPLAALPAAIEQRLAHNADTPVVISGDKNVHYEAVTKVMDALYQLHVRRVGLAVKPAP